MRRHPLLPIVCLAFCLASIPVNSAEAPAQPGDADIVTKVLQTALKTPTPQANLAYIRQSVDKDESRFNALLRENLPSNPQEAAELQRVRASKLGFLTNGIRWSLIQEISGACSVILGIENLDTAAPTQTLPSHHQVEKITKATPVWEQYPFEERWLYDSDERFGYRVADYFRGPNSCLTSSGANAPIRPTPKLARFDGLEPELVGLLLNALKATNSHPNRKPSPTCHPDWIDYGQVQVPPDLVTKALAEKVVTVMTAPGQSRLRVNLGNSISMVLEFSENGPLHFPRVEVTMNGKRLRLITRTLTPDQPWRGVWHDETTAASGAPSSFTTRYIMESRPVELDREIEAFHARYVHGAEAVTKVSTEGNSTTSIQSTNGSRLLPLKTSASRIRLGVKVLMGVLVLGALPFLLAFRHVLRRRDAP